MVLRKIIPFLAVGALAVAAVAGFLSYQTVFAQTTDPTSTVPAQQDTQRRAPDGFPGGRHGGVSDEDLAAALDISVEDLQAAQQTARAEALQQAVSQGLITQEQADEYLANDFHGRLPGLRVESSSEIDYDALLAKALGITTEELSTARQSAITANIDQAVEDGNLTQEQADVMKARNALSNDETFQSAMQSAYEAAIQQAVKTGVITQAQADAMLKDTPSVFGRGGFEGPGFDHHGRHGADSIPTVDQ